MSFIQAVPVGDVAIFGGAPEPVEHPQVEIRRARLLLLEENLRREEVGAVFPLVRDQTVDLFGLVTF